MSRRALTLRVILVTSVLVLAVASLSAATPAAPTVKSVSPRAGAIAGGDSVTITGSGFVSGDTAVDFGAKASPSVTVTTPGKLTAITPAGSAGTVDVTVTTANGPSAVGDQDKYAYGPPSVTSVAPGAGPVAGGNTVTITGTAFVPGSVVRFGTAVASSVTFVSGTELQAVAPAGSAGTVNVRVDTPAGSSATGDADEYSYGAPTVINVSPRSGATAGGNPVTITGTGFVPGATTVDFGTNPGSSVTVSSPAKLTAVAPAGPAGTVDVRVTTNGGESPVSDLDAYAYGAPTVTGVSPSSGDVAGGNTVTITGTGFVPGNTVRFGGSNTASAVTFVSGTELRAVAPAGSAGAVNIRVSTAAGASAITAADEYTYGAQLTMSSLGGLLAGNVPLEADSATAPGLKGATADFEYSPTGKDTWKPACSAVSTTARYTCNWDTAVVPDGVYDLRAVSTGFGTAPTLSGLTVSNAVPAPTIAGARDGQTVQGQLTLTTNPLPKPDLAGLSQNLVPDWSMESLDERGSPVGWRAVAKEPDFLPQLPVGLKGSSVFKPTAAGAAQMNVKTLTAGSYAFAWSYTRRIPVTAGHSYRASVLMDVDTIDPGLYATVMVTWYDASNHQISRQQGTVTQTTGVATLTLNPTAPAGAAYAVFSPAIFNTGTVTGASRVIVTAPRFELGTGTPAVNENVTVQYRYPGSDGGWQDLTDGCQITQTSSFQCPVPLDQLVDGPVQLRIAVVDSAGHFGYSPTVTPTVFKPGIAFTQPSYTAHESQRALAVTISRSDTSADEFFYYGVQGVTAQPGIDFGAVAPVAAEMPAGQSTYTFQVPITDRGINGPPLQAQLYLSNSYPERIATPQVPLTIVRDDPLQRRGHSNPLGLRGARHNPLHGAKLYVPGALSAVGQAQQQLSLNDPKASQALARIGTEPLTRVLTPASGLDVASTVAGYLEQASVSQPGTVPLLATHYLAPSRCARGADSPTQRSVYQRWITSLGYGIGNFPAVVFLELGTTETSTCMSSEAVAARGAEIAFAVRTLEADPHVVVYLDGGGAGERSAAWSARFLRRAGVARAQGFFLNAADYDWVTGEVSFGQQLSARLHGANFVIDTSQDGRGPAPKGAACRQHDRGLGPISTQTGYRNANALLWISGPGISDGSCKGSPAAGSFWPSYAVTLVARAVHKITGPHYRLHRASHFVEYGVVERKSAR